MKNYPISDNVYYYAEPTKLFNFYFNERYESFSYLIETIFGMKENLIKILKNQDSIENIFRFQNLEIIIFDGVIDLFFRPTTKAERKKVQETMNKIVAIEIPQVLLNKENIDIFLTNIEPIQIFFISHGKKLSKSSKSYKILQTTKEGESFLADICLRYPNHLIVTQTLYEDLNNMFLDLKEMLS